MLARIIHETGKEQTIKEHSENTAKICADKLKHIGLEKTAYLTGMLHDAGKCCCEFQRYLEENNRSKRGSVIHSAAAAVYLYDKYYERNKLLTQLMADAIIRHHGRLFDCINLDAENIFYNTLMNHKNKGYSGIMDEFFQEVISEDTIELLFCEAEREIAECTDGLNEFGLGMLQKELYSALIDADRYDAYCLEAEIEPELLRIPDWSQAKENMEKRRNEFTRDTEINKVRCIISDKCYEAAEIKKGIYRLAVPTGAGKTLSSLRFALNFADKYNKKHIFYVIPYTTIIDQTAEEVRSICGDDMVLEHHSNVIIEDDSDEYLKYQKLTERWTAPVILTTVVQFMNSLYAGKPACARRMNELCNSVIVIDEVQAIPMRLIGLFNEAINFLTEQCDTSVVLCTATQPSLDKLKEHSLHIGEDADIVEHDEELFNVFKRTEIVNKFTNDGMEIEEIADFAMDILSNENSLLIVTNTTKEAKDIYEAIDCDCEKRYLTTKKCKAHRSKEIEKIKERTAYLSKNEIAPHEKLIVVSTQLVEAGVDFSFGSVIRAAAGIDNIIQAAGRCNRNGEFSDVKSVYVVNIKNERLTMLRDIDNAKKAAKAVFVRLKNKPIDDQAVKLYYKAYIRDNERDCKYPLKSRNNEYLMDLLSDNYHYKSQCDDKKNLPILCQAFETAGRAFRAIDNSSISVIVPYEKGKEYIDILNGNADIKVKKKIIAKCNAYTVNLYDWELTELEKKGAIIPIESVGAYALAEEFYGEDIGLRTEAQWDLCNM